MNSTAENEISITVKVKDQTAAGMAAAKDSVIAGGAAAAAEAEIAGDKISENLANGLTRDSGGRLRDAMGRFAKDVDKEAAGIGGGKGIEVPIAVDGDDFEREFRAAMSDAEQAGKDADAALTRSFGDVEKASRTTRAAAAELGPALDGVAASAEGAGDALDGAGKKADGAGKNANNSASNFAFLHSKVFLLTSAALALGPALAVVPAALGAAAFGAGTMALAFGGVVGALRDYAAESANSAQAGAQTAATAFSNAVAIKNAEQAITDAKRQEAQQAQSSAQAIVAAEQAVGDAERQAAQQAQQSADSVAAADRTLEQAELSLTQAQLSLTQAQKDAVNTLADLNNANADAANSVADATNSVADAQAAWDAAKNNSLLTDQQKKEAYQALIDAQQRLTDAQQKATEASQAATDANAKGVDGSTAVVSAQQAVQTALQNVADAQHAMAVAQETAANQQISSNEAVAKAQQGLVQAQQSAAQQQQAAAEQVSKAVQNLADMQTQQALAAQSAGASNNKFASDMQKMTGPAQDLVKQILGMKGGLHELSVTAQDATLPGFTTMLRDSSGLLPTINGAVHTMGSGVSNVAVQFGNLIKGPAFQGQLHDVLQQAADLAHRLGDGMVNMVSGVTQAAAKAGPIVFGLGGGLQQIMGAGIPEFLTGLVSNAGQTGQLFSGLGSIITQLLGPLGNFAGALSGALGPFITQLAQSLMPLLPQLGTDLDSVAKLFGAILLVVGPLLPIIATGLVGALKIVNPLLESLSKFLGDNHAWLAPMTGILLGIVGAMKAWAIIQAILDGEIALSPIGLLITLISGLVLGVIYCWEHFVGFRDFVKQMWSDLKGWFQDGVAFLETIWKKITADAQIGWQLVHDYIINPLKQAWTDVTGWGAEIITFVTGLPGKAAAAGAGIWNWVSSGFTDIMATISLSFHTIINDLITGINWAIGYVNGATNSISDAWTWIPGAGGTAIPQIPDIPLWKAMGGPTGGLTGMGEGGIEMFRLPNGTTVIPHSNTASALQAAGAGGSTQLQLEWAPGAGGGDELLTWFRRQIRIRGGSGKNSVQAVLGQVH